MPLKVEEQDGRSEGLSVARINPGCDPDIGVAFSRFSYHGTPQSKLSVSRCASIVIYDHKTHST